VAYRDAAVEWIRGRRRRRRRRRQQRTRRAFRQSAPVVDKPIDILVVTTGVGIRSPGHHAWGRGSLGHVVSGHRVIGSLTGSWGH